MQHLKDDLIKIAVEKFQSLSGFLRPCNFVSSLLPAANSWVSIPIGFSQALQQLCLLQQTYFSISFNPYRVFSGLATETERQVLHSQDLFQSLSGFLRPCNQGIRREGRSGNRVSIPIGFSQALQQDRLEIHGTLDDRFQSLSGFLRPCNVTPAV